MKRLLKHLIYTTTALAMSLSCSHNEVFYLDPKEAEIKFACDGEKVTEEFVDVEAKVFNPNFISETENEQNLLTFFYLTTDQEAINQPGNYWKGEALVPTNLPKSFWVVGKRVIFSGRKTSCCGLHTSPDPRIFMPNFKPFGCKLEITKIQEKPR
ncbi:MAG: hypothetical protein ACK4GN_05855 [Runella sp.]